MGLLNDIFTFGTGNKAQQAIKDMEAAALASREQFIAAEKQQEQTNAVTAQNTQYIKYGIIAVVVLSVIILAIYLLKKKKVI